MSERTVATSKLNNLASKAKGLIKELDVLGAIMERRLRRGLDRAWRLGKCLCEAKDTLGHGKWLVWVEANLPITDRRARHYKELAEANPAAASVDELSPESVRKFRLGYVPDKESPALPGDGKVPRVFHHITLLNDFNRLTRRVKIGQAKLDEPAAKKDLWPVFEWLVQLYGIEPEVVSHLRPASGG